MIGRRARPTLALCGAGRAAALHASAAVRAGFRITAVASRSAERARDLAALCGAEAVGYDGLAGRADAVVVCTPPSHHAEAVACVLDGATWVMVDRPLAGTPDEAAALLRHPGAARIAAGENLLHAPAVGAFLARVRGLGELNHIEIVQAQPAPDVALPGDSAVWRLGPSAVALALATAGRRRLISVTHRHDRSVASGSGDGGTLMLDFEDGLRATVRLGDRTDGVSICDLQASSATGVLRASPVAPGTLEHNGDPVSLVQDQDPLVALGYVGQLADLARAVDDGQPTLLPVRFGAVVAGVVDAARRSAESGGNPVPPPPLN